MAFVSFSALCLFFAFVGLSTGKVFDKCELAEELDKLGASKGEISTWVCIAFRESTYNTSAVGNQNYDGSKDHGLFQLSDKYWCSSSGSKNSPNACGKDCKDFEDDDIRDDWKCVKRVFKAHRLQEGNGFKAWAVYSTYCSGVSEILSFPHFLKASDQYKRMIGGLTPDMDQHFSYLDVEPNTGIPLSAKKRVQVNFEMKGTPALKITGQAPGVLMPLLWMEESAELGDDQIQLLQNQLLTLLRIVGIVQWVLIGVGAFTAIVGFSMAFYVYRKARR